MKQFICLIFILFFKIADAKTFTDDNPDCSNAILISQLSNYCTADAQYATTVTHTTTWFKFVATKYDITITVTGQTLTSPTVSLYANCAGSELVGTSSTSNNVTNFYKGGLIIGSTYYIAISSGNNIPGTFKLCINNYNPILQAGQDCETASLLCSTQTFSQLNVTGAGNNNRESAGTCIDNGIGAPESNSVWYKWKAANNGTLVFTITPNNASDDIDFVLFDLDITGDCANVNPAHAIRCTAGNGVLNKTFCPTEPVYYKTGLDFSSTDISEAGECGSGQDGKVKFITMQQGHYYALLINNFISQNNGFTLEFKDQHGVAGTGLFAGPKAAIGYTAVDTCTSNQQFQFASNSTDYASLKWNFGIGASIQSATGVGPYTITYTTLGIKTITLEAVTDKGCIDIDYKTINVAQKPPLPTIKVNKANFCLKDTIILSVPAQTGYAYHWTGPNNFSADSAMVKIPVINKQQAGTYTLHLSQLNCISDADSVVIPAVYDNPEASFYTSPSLPAKLSVPIDIKFYNQSVNADNYLWDFGDGQTSTEVNPIHHYTDKGTYKIKLTAFKQTVCSSSLIQGDYIFLDGAGIYVSNTFTPNGDGINDQFNINLANLSRYHIDIFNRYGVKLFQSPNITINWDGNYNGKPVPTGVYYYSINAIDLNGQVIRQSGYVTLIR